MDQVLKKVLERAKILWKVDENSKYHPLLTSGLHSDLYLNTTKLLQSPGLTRMFLTEYVDDKIIDFLSECDYLVGIESGGIPIVYMMSMLFPKLSVPKVIFVPKRGFRESYWPDIDGKIVFVDDLITTGSTIAKLISTLPKKKSIRVKGIFTLFKRMTDDSILVKGHLIRIKSCLEVMGHEWVPSECPLCKAGSKPIRPKKEWNSVCHDILD